MSETRVKIQSIIENQIPDFIAEESPLLVDFLRQYYISQEYKGAPVDLIQNIDQYLKLEENALTTEFTYLSEDVSITDTTINAGALGVGDEFNQISIDRGKYGIAVLKDAIQKGFDRSEEKPNPQFTMKESLSSKISKMLNEEYKRRNFIK